MELTTTALRYVEDMLGISLPEPKSWPSSVVLPFFLLDAFEFVVLTLAGRSVVWAVDRGAAKLTPAEVRQRLDHVESLTQERVVYVTRAMASHDRRRLIQLRVPFLVPGNQLYLPELAIDLREHFRQGQGAAPTTFSPSTQALLIEALLRDHWTTDWRPVADGPNGDYSPMTRSRAFRELTAAGVGDAHKEGRLQMLRFKGNAADVWARARPLMRSPVSREAWVLPIAGTDERLPRAGVSALAAHSMLAEPAWTTRALTNAQWKAAFDQGAAMLEGFQEGASLWQLWTYAPDIDQNAKTVDPISLTLSLQNDSDERVQMALDELKECFPWSED